MKPTLCPITGKHCHRTQGSAIRALLRRSRKSGGTPLRTYRCECGAWHLTSQSKHESGESA